MISFVSLFLGLVVGYQTVALKVAEPVARVEILLDGHQVTAFDTPPWRGQIDLGRELQPHELTAVAFDDTGVELDRTSQWLNLPRQPAETTILLERDLETQQQTARVSWKSLAGDQPSAVRVEFDGRDLDFEDPRTIPLPPYDPELLHFLRVELDFAGFVSSSAEITFGGAYADQVNAELTAFPVQLAGRKKLPTEAELQDGFLARGRPLRVAAVERGTVDLLVVRDQGAWAELRRIRTEALTAPAPFIARDLSTYERRGWFRAEQAGWRAWTFQFLWPVPRRLDSGSGTYDLFSHSAKHAASTGSLHGWLTTLEQPAEWTGAQRLADAVAIAAVTAAGGNRRRAVLLVLGEESRDASDASAASVRRYLQNLAVPLFVWTVDPAANGDSPWGPATEVSSPKLMSRATSKLFRALESQAIVWLEGIYLPQQIHLASTLDGIDRISTR